MKTFFRVIFCTALLAVLAPAVMNGQSYYYYSEVTWYDRDVYTVDVYAEFCTIQPYNYSFDLLVESELDNDQGMIGYQEDWEPMGSAPWACVEFSLPQNRGQSIYIYGYHEYWFDEIVWWWDYSDDETYVPEAFTPPDGESSSGDWIALQYYNGEYYDGGECYA